MNKRLKLALAILMLASVAGCSSMDSAQIVTGERRDSIDTDQVVLYETAPANYRILAMISARSAENIGNSDERKQQAIEYLKQRAAAMGANGILIYSMAGDTDIADRVVYNTFTGGGVVVTDEEKPKTVFGRAIYVADK
ncbi:hypothetical protein [Shewanella sp.]|uniref:hypothetical protein n=1 Tax=Shewanella sp. TaxID=50422 RepID=UPI003A971291